MGDNPTAGGAGDVTWTLNELIKRKEFKSENGPSVVYASIPDQNLHKKQLKLVLEEKLRNLLVLMLIIDFRPPLN